jgi:DNA-binding NarL/FixJ family response regulator
MKAHESILTFPGLNVYPPFGGEASFSTTLFCCTMSAYPNFLGLSTSCMNTLRDITIALVEDDDSTRYRIAALLQQRMPHAVIIEFQDLTTAKKHIFAESNSDKNPETKAKKQDFWLVDLGLPDGSGIELIRCIKQIHSDANVLVLSVFGDVDNIVNSIEAGANGYLLKDAVERDLIDALDAIDSGGTPLSPMIASRLLERMMPVKVKNASSHADHVLTTREAELLNYLSRGYTATEAGERMQVAVSTVRTHIKNIYSKLAVKSRTEAVFEARAMGILPK